MTYLLDTCAVSDFVKGESGTLKKMKALSPAEILISTITEMEINFALELNPDVAKKIRPMLKDFLSAIKILPFGSEEAAIAGKVRADLQQRGKPIGAHDLLILSTALSKGLKLVTSNLREF